MAKLGNNKEGKKYALGFHNLHNSSSNSYEISNKESERTIYPTETKTGTQFNLILKGKNGTLYNGQDTESFRKIDKPIPLFRKDVHNSSLLKSLSVSLYLCLSHSTHIHNHSHTQILLLKSAC